MNVIGQDAGSKAPQWVPKWNKRCLEPVRTSRPVWGSIHDTGADNLGIKALGAQIRPIA